MCFQVSFPLEPCGVRVLLAAAVCERMEECHAQRLPSTEAAQLVGRVFGGLGIRHS